MTLKQQKKNKRNRSEKWLKRNSYKFRKITVSKFVFMKL